MLAVLGVLCLALAVLWWRARRDLATARLETERLREMVRRKVERPNVFSHEVRTPIALVLGAAELLAEETPGPLTRRQREFVATIETNGRLVHDMAQNLLVEARIDAQLFDLHLARVDLRALVHAVVRDARALHATTVRLDEAGTPVALLADASLVRQAMWNLVNNACRHAGPRGTLTVALDVAAGEAVVAVGDDGGGMSSGERARLFEPFASSGRGGTGLGMTITDRIIAEHGGRLLVDSAPDRGTTIFVTLPLAGPAGVPEAT